MLQSFTLSNGIRVVTYSMSSLRSMHLRINVKGGALVEDASHFGVAHFMEHMLVQGIPSYPDAQSLSVYMESLAGNYNAYTSKLTVSFAATVPFLHTKDAIRIASEVFFTPLFPEAAMEKERRAVINEIKQEMDSQWFPFQNFHHKIRYIKDSPLTIRTGGTIETVNSMQREDLLEYWTNFFVPKNTYIFLIGNFSNIKVKELLEEYFGNFSSEKGFSGFPEIDRKQLKGRKVAIRYDGKLRVNYVDFSFPSLSLFDDVRLRVEQNIALIILGRLRTSRLFQLLRYEKGYVYGVSADDTQWPGVGMVDISSEVSSEHLDEVITLIADELMRFIEKGPTEEELDFTKHYLENSWQMSFDNPGSIADWISGEFLWKEKVLLPEDYVKLISTISVKGIVDVMKKYWDLKKLQLLIQGPIKNTEKNIEKYTGMIEKLV